ncbi:MAG: efflux RND transporter periplasmic adaptor subunit [Gemmobacter sp.]
MRFLIRALSGLFLMALTVGLLALAGYTVKSSIDERLARESRPAAARERVFAANVIRIEPATIVPEMTAFGAIEARRSLELRAPAAGRILDLAENFEDGAPVAAGEVLVRLDPADAQADLDLARAALEEARAAEADALRAVELARDDLALSERQSELRARAFARQSEIAERGLATAADLETAELAAASAAAAALARRQSLAQAESRRASAANALARQAITLAEAERRLADTVIRAGFDGALSGVSAVEGGLVSNNERLGLLIDPAALEVSFRVSTAQFVRLLDAGGQIVPAEVRVPLDVLGAEIVAAGRISRVGAAVGEGQTGRLVYAALDAAPGFRPGDFVTVTIAEPPLEGVARVPATAVGDDGMVLVLGPEDRLEEVRVVQLRRQQDDVLIAAQGLAGREIVAERSPLLGAGIKVRPLRPGAGADAPAGAPPDARAGGGAPAAQAAAADPDFVELTPERREALIALVEGNARMPAEAKARVIAQLRQDRVPARVVARLEERSGG